MTIQPKRSITRCRLVVAATTVLSLILSTAAAFGPAAGRAGADGDSGASSRVTPGGDIVTAILFSRSTRRVLGRGPRGQAPVTWWHTLTDAELSTVLAMAAGYPELEIGFLDELTVADDDLGRDLQVEMGVDGPTGRTRVIDAPMGNADAVRISREMITRLATPDLDFSPARAVVVPLREPVFVHVPTATWAATRTDVLSVGGVTAVVRAHRTRIEVYSGDPGTRFDRVRCDGPGRAFDPSAAAGAIRQATAPGACTFSYRTATGSNSTATGSNSTATGSNSTATGSNSTATGSNSTATGSNSTATGSNSTATGTAARRDRWYGVVTVLWDAEWSRDGGVTWSPLGEIPESQVFTRRVRAVLTRIETR